jgi:hypothetical protein
MTKKSCPWWLAERHESRFEKLEILLPWQHQALMHHFLQESNQSKLLLRVGGFIYIYIYIMFSCWNDISPGSRYFVTKRTRLRLAIKKPLEPTWPHESLNVPSIFCEYFMQAMLVNYDCKKNRYLPIMLGRKLLKCKINSVFPSIFSLFFFLFSKMSFMDLCCLCKWPSKLSNLPSRWRMAL